MFHTVGLRMPQRSVQNLRFGQSTSTVEDQLQTLRQNGQKIQGWSLLYVPGEGRITQGEDPELGCFRLFETTTGPKKEYSLEVGDAWQTNKMPLTQEQYDAIRTNCLRDIAAEKIGLQYGLEGLFGLTKLLGELKTRLQTKPVKLQTVPANSVHIEGIMPDITAAKVATLRDGTQVTLMVRDKASLPVEYFVGLEKPGFRGQIIAASEPEEQQVFKSIFEDLKC
ncbi:MAG TPA: hypothetical protein V6C52_09155 [Coleofasciculaceae cyanobacterium]|jgi:hypothetical protein